MSRNGHTVRPCNRRWRCSVSRDSRGCCRALHCLTIPIECSFFSCCFNYWSMITLRPSHLLFSSFLESCDCYSSVDVDRSPVTLHKWHQRFSMRFFPSTSRMTSEKEEPQRAAALPIREILSVSGEALVASWRSWKSNTVASSFPKVKKVDAKWKGGSHSISASQVKSWVRQ